MGILGIKKEKRKLAILVIKTVKQTELSVLMRYPKYILNKNHRNIKYDSKFHQNIDMN